MRRLLPALLAVFILIPGQTARATDLGLTPDHVFGLWQSVNTALIDAPGWLAGDRSLAEPIAALAPKATDPTRTPGDVLAQIAAFRDKLDVIRNGLGLLPTPKFAYRGEVTPTVVFLNSGHVLDSLVIAMIERDDGRDVSKFFFRNDVENKTPGDVYALVELANRRLDLLTGAGG